MSNYVFQQLPPSNSEKRKIDIISYLGKLFFMVEVKDRNSRGFYGGFSLQVFHFRLTRHTKYYLKVIRALRSQNYCICVDPCLYSMIKEIYNNIHWQQWSGSPLQREVQKQSSASSWWSLVSAGNRRPKVTSS